MSTIGADPNSILTAQIANEQRNTLQNRTGLQQPSDRSAENRETVQRGEATRPDTRTAVTGIPDNLENSIATARARGEEQSGVTLQSGGGNTSPTRGQFVNIFA